MVAAPSQKTADIDRRLRALVAAFGAVALLNPPTDALFGAVVGAVDGLTFLRAVPGAVAGQTRPQVPAVQEEQARAIGEFGALSFARCARLRITVEQVLQFALRLRLAAGPVRPAARRGTGRRWLHVGRRLLGRRSTVVQRLPALAAALVFFELETNLVEAALSGAARFISAFLHTRIIGAA